MVLRATMQCRARCQRGRLGLQNPVAGETTALQEPGLKLYAVKGPRIEEAVNTAGAQEWSPLKPEKRSPSSATDHLPRTLYWQTLALFFISKKKEFKPQLNFTDQVMKRRFVVDRPPNDQRTLANLASSLGVHHCRLIPRFYPETQLSMNGQSEIGWLASREGPSKDADCIRQSSQSLGHRFNHSC